MYFGGVEEEEEKLERECIALQKKKREKKSCHKFLVVSLLVTLRKSGMHKIWVVKAEDYFRDAHNAGAERWR